MAENKYNVPQISAETLAAIRRKSAYNLPDRPSERGMKPDEIKRAIAGPVTDSENSAIAELNRVIADINRVLGLIEAANDKYTISVNKIEGGHRLTITDENGDKNYDIMDGGKGDKGDDGEDGADGSIADYDIITSLNTTDYKLTVSLVDAGGKVVSSSVVDFPLESVVVDGDEEGGIVTLTLQNGNAITFDISDLVDGLVSQTKHDEDIAALGARIDALEESGVASADLTELDTLIGEGV